LNTSAIKDEELPDQLSDYSSSRRILLHAVSYEYYDTRGYNRDSSVGIETGYGLDGLGSIPGRSKRDFFTPQRPDRLWAPPNLLSDGYRGFFPRV
jgi:hypothetical protein